MRAAARRRISAARITPVPSGLVSSSERQLGHLGAVAADQHRAGGFQHLAAALHHMEQVVLDDRRARRRHRGDRQGGLGDAAHRVDVAERMGRGDAPEQIGVVDQRAEEIDRLQ
jgi:hypothetical protein